MRAALSLMVEVMLTDPATHRYSCCGVFVAVSFTILFVSLFHYIYQTGKHIRKKGKIHGRKSEGSSKLPASTDLMPSEVKCNYCCQFVKYVLYVCYVVIVTISIICRDFLKVLMFLPILFNCTALKVGYSVIVNFFLCMHLNPIFSQEWIVLYS